MPENSVDPIVVAASMVMRPQTIVSWEVAPRPAAVLTIGSFHAGLKENIIPDRAEFTINVRTFEAVVRDTVISGVRRIVAAEAAASRAPEPVIEDISAFPPLYNDPAETAKLAQELRAELGEDKVLQGTPVMGSEDFGALATAIGIPSVFWFFGANTEEALTEGHPPANHSPFFAPVIEPTLSTTVTAATRE